MTVSINFTTSISANGLSISGQTSVTAEGEGGSLANPTVLQARPGALTVRTSGTVGSLTMETGHGITTGQRIDLYWEGGKAYGCTVGTVSGLVVPITATEGGDAFPSAATAIIAGIANQVPFDIVGDNMLALVATSGVAPNCQIVLHDGTDDHLRIPLAVGETYAWYTGLSTNPIAGDTPTKVWISHDDVSRDITDIRVAFVVS